MTEVNDGETLDVECTVDRVYPVDGLQFQLMSSNTAVSSTQSGSSTETNSDDTFNVIKTFRDQRYLRSYSPTQDGLVCKVYHPRGDAQSNNLGIIVQCE